MNGTGRSQMLQDVLADMGRLARELGAAPVAQAIGDFSAQLARGPLRLAVVGPVGAGKSSLINALLGQPLLPEGRLRTTGRVVTVTTGGRAIALEGLRPDGTRAPMSEAQFQNACLGAGRWALVSAGAPPAEPLSVPITLADTPGLDPSGAAIPPPVLSELKKADGLILVSDYRSALTDQAATWLKAVCREISDRAILWVCNFCPSPFPDERTAALEQWVVRTCGRPVQTLRVMDRDKAGFPPAPIHAAVQALLTGDERLRLAGRTLVWEAMQLWQRLESALAAQETEAAARREAAAAAEGRIRQLELLRDQGLDAAATFRSRVEEQFVAQIADRLVQTELDARCATLDLTISRLGAELRTALRGVLDQASVLAAAAPPGAAERPRRWTPDQLADSTPPCKKYLVKRQRDPASLKADLLHRYRTAAGDLATRVQELIGGQFDGLLAAQRQKHEELAAAAQRSGARLNSLRAGLQATGESLRRLGRSEAGG